jgi:hypothetical protein
MQVEYKHYLLLALLRRRRRRHQEAASPWLHHQFITAAKKKVRAGITISKKLKQQRLEGHLSLWWGRPAGDTHLNPGTHAAIYPSIISPRPLRPAVALPSGLSMLATTTIQG